LSAWELGLSGSDLGLTLIATSKPSRQTFLIENFFAKLNPYRAMATRYDKLAETFLSAIYMVAYVIWLI
jgi:hypothetical protein